MTLALIHHRTSPLARTTLMRAVDQGQLLRLRPGVFVETWAWLTAKPWTRHAAAAAALALQKPGAVFCRETALAIYGVPLLSVPTAVDFRACSTSECGAAASTPMTGRGLAAKIARLKAEAARREDAYVSALKPIPLRRWLPPVPQQHRALESRKLYWSAETGPGIIRVPVPEVCLEDGSPAEAMVEPLPFTLMDTLPRLSGQQAVVAMDAVLAGRYGYGKPVRLQQLEGVGEWLWNQKARAAWEWSLGFADPLSESPGESRSRVLIHQLGFVVPKLQSTVVLPEGSTARLDFEWQADGVVGEFDGRIKFDKARELSGAPEAGVYWDQVRREEKIRDTGRKVARWNWEDLAEPRRLELKLLREGVSRR